MGGFPIQPEQLTSEWFTEVLTNAGALSRQGDDEVESFTTDFIGDGIGLLGMVIRANLHYANGSGGGPESVVIKFAHPVPENRAIATNLNMYEREVRFFNEIAEQVDVPKPVCYFAGMDYEAAANIVVLEDMKRYRAGDQVAGVTIDEARSVIDAIVPLHAAFWGKTDTEQLAGMMRVDSTYIEPFMPGVEYTWENAVEQFGYCITDDVKEALPRYIAGMREFHRVMGRRTQTLIHGDVRMDNAMFGDGKPGLAPVVMVDWQAIMVSNPGQDIAWMLSTCIPTPERRAHEDELVAYYHQKMVDAGCAGYTLEQCVDDYEVGVLYLLAYALIIAGAFDPANERGKGLAEECLRRSAQTVTDRGLLRRIPRVTAVGQLDGSTTIVTGAGRGIGRAIARVYAREGANVAVVSRTRVTVDQVVAEITDAGGVAVGITCDVGVKEQVFAAVEQTIAEFGTVDVLVNNAQGFGTNDAPRSSTKYMGVEDTPDDEIEYIFRTGTMATLWGMQAVYPTMKARGWGKIINFTSTSGILGTTGNTAYNVTKEAIRALSRTAANEWGQHGINVNMICPTLKTDAFDAWEADRPEFVKALRENLPMRRLGDPEIDGGPLAVFLAGHGSDFITGMTFMLNGGKLMP